MKLACFFAIFIICSFCGYGQQLQQVAHCPSTEVYDLLIDKQGFLWVAHNLGISRYDGISFTSFSNPAQSSLSVTDLVEDNYGRIWCHNFNGQVFYIQHDKMYYLKEYDFKNESLFPRMVLYGDELVVTSNAGLFICNTATLACKYLRKADVKMTGPASLCVIDNSVIAFGGGIWYMYSKQRGFRIMRNDEINVGAYLNLGASLQPETYKNTCFLIDNRITTLYCLEFINKKLVTKYVRHEKSYINTVSIVNGNPWLNTQKQSFCLQGNDTARGYNLTIIMGDNEGNMWFGSLVAGLLVQIKPSAWKIVPHANLAPKDYIKLLSVSGHSIVAVSQFGQVSIKSPPGYNAFLPISKGINDNSTMANIQAAGDSNLFIATSNHLYILYAKTKQVVKVDTNSVKDIVVNGNTAYIAIAIGVEVKNIAQWKLKSSSYPFSIDDSNVVVRDKKTYIKKLRRCRAVLFDAVSNSLLISYTDGLQRFKNNRLTFILYNGQPLYVSSMARHGNKIYAGTFNNGLFIIDGYKVRKVANNSESPQNAIVKIKRCNNHIWIFRSDDIEVLDAATEKFADIYPFPADIADITDVEEDSSNIYLAAHTGLFTIPTSTKVETVKADPSLLYVLVNNTDTIQQTDITLPANKNNLLFRLAIPVYKDADQLHFKYSLYNGGDTTGNTWYYTQDAQRDIQFNALKPGSYTLEITAMQDDREIADKHLVYNFTISKPWFSTWWFYTTVLLFTVSVSIAVYQYRLYQHVKMERMRRKISNDLHDDIGSTLSSINVYSQLAKGNFGNEGFIDTIQNNTVSIINNLDDLVWNINPKNDVLWQLVSRMKLFAESLLQEKGIECIFKVKLTEKDFVVSPNARAHLYLLFKEIINNIIKHSGSTKCSVYIMQKNKALRLTVTDNGRGFNVKNASQHRNGLRIMGERVKELKGELNINSAPGTGTDIKITCYLK